MTEKRFKLSYPNGAFLIDGNEPLCHMKNDLMIIDLLNELHEENKELKKKLESKQRLINAYDNYIKTLKEDGVLDD